VPAPDNRCNLHGVRLHHPEDNRHGRYGKINFARWALHPLHGTRRSAQHPDDGREFPLGPFLRALDSQGQISVAVKPALTSRALSFVLLLQPRNHAEILERGGIALHLATTRQLAQQPAHNLPAPGLRQHVRKANIIRLRQ
jgi:hypothetical protein